MSALSAPAPPLPPVPSFEFASAGRIVFGRGCSDRVPGLCKELGATRVLVVTGATPTRASPLLAALRSAGLHADVFAAPGGGEPTLDTAAAGVAAGRALAADCVVGFGGGSALDLAKAVAALMTQPQPLLHYMEVVGGANPLDAKARHAGRSRAAFGRM